MSRKTMQNNVMKVKRLKLSSQDAVGGIVQSKVTVFTAPCRIRLLGASERMVGGKDGIVSTHRIYCDKVSIQPKDEVIVNKIVFDVNTINPGSFNKGSLEVDVTKRV